MKDEQKLPAYLKWLVPVLVLFCIWMVVECVINNSGVWESLVLLALVLYYPISYVISRNR
jgi:hypothetical protein